MLTTTSEEPFSHLSPDCVAQAIESLGFYLQTEPFALNSYENRVYLFRDDDQVRWVAKFYRPERWTDDAILDEHHMLTSVHKAGVLVGLPWADAKGTTLHHRQGYRMAIFHHVSGRAPSLDAPDDLFALGETIGKVHLASRSLTLSHRPALVFDVLARQARDTIMQRAPLTAFQRSSYQRITSALLTALEGLPLEGILYRPLHGDCHIGNILGDAHAGFALVDFDDCMVGPAVQDLWMFLSGNREDERRQQLSELIEGYEMAEIFDRRQLALIEPLATLRIMRHAAWLTTRWRDPAFPAAFSDITCEAFWDGHLRLLEGQLQVLRTPILWV